MAEVKDKRYRKHPTENIILGERDPQQSLTTQYQVQNETQIRKNQKVIRKDNELVVNNYTKNKQPIQQQPKFKPPNCPFCKINKWLDVDKEWYCQNGEHIINKQKHQNDKKKFVDKIIIFQLDCHMLIRRLERNINLWLLLLIIEHKIRLIKYNS